LKSRLALASLKCNAQRETVGERAIVVTVAEQTTTYDGYFELVCYDNFYAMEGEHCVECPKDLESTAYAAECKMGNTSPLSYVGWYYEPL
jgi:hypothetical protein